MTNYLLRRTFQMLIVLLLSAAVTYALLMLAPGGPLQGLRQLQQNDLTRLSAEDFARIRARFELDIYLPFRFTRWLVGWPRGPLSFFGQTYLTDFQVGCNIPVEESYQLPNGSFGTRFVGCGDYVLMSELVGRRVSRGVLFGDFGDSWGILRDRPVSLVLWSRLPYTLQLIGLSTFIALLIGVPLGVFSAIRQYSIFDYIVTTLAFMGSAMPTFFFGIVLILVFGILFKRAGWVYLPPGDAQAVRDYVIPLLGQVSKGSLKDIALHMIMPTSVLVFVSVAGWSRFVRASMLEVLRQDYVRTARAKGLLEQVVVAKHALRNALIPFVTVAVFTIPGLFGGAIITETVFNWPGMGRLFFDALGRNDYPVSMAILLITAVLTVVATLLGDVLYTLVDPRIKLS
jgi:peptide/nickel transport system permease protein